MLCIVGCSHCMQFQGKPTNWTWKNGNKKPSFEPDIGTFGQILAPKIVFVEFCSKKC